MNEPSMIMGMAGVGFFGMLLIGFLAGWIAERAMNRDHGLLTNILVGIAGSFVGGTAASILGFQWYGFVGNLVVATVGAIGILWFFGRRETPNAERLRRNNRIVEDDTSGSGKGGSGTGVDNQPLPPIYHSSDAKKKK